MFTKVFYKNITALQQNKSVIVNYGGSSSSKTITVMQILRILAERKENLYILLIANSVPKLKTTLIKDFKNIIMSDDYDDRLFNKQDNEYKFNNGSIFKFANAYHEDTYKGVRCDYAMLDECNTFRNGQGVFDQIEIRTAKTVFLTFNPSSKFWVTDVMSREDSQTIHSTYKDNQYIESAIINKLELRAKTNENFYKVYVLGEWGALEGLVFEYKKHWDYFTDRPKEYDAIYYGGDFGFANDPTTAIEVLVNNSTKEMYVTELLYKKGLLNSQIAEILKPIIKDNYIIFDSAEPKSIVSLRNEHGLLALSAVKGPDSIRAGIERLKEWKILVNENSKNLINELFNYAYVDKEGLLNVPIDDFNHCIDALRYVALKYRL